MKKILLSLVCMIAGWQCAFAEEPALYDTVRAKLDSIFEYVDKNAVPTGLLGMSIRMPCQQGCSPSMASTLRN